jgi:diaminopimelate epimerase
MEYRNQGVRFAKYHALGNDYLVISPDWLDQELTVEQIQRICHRHHGIGSDGILLGPLDIDRADFGLRIFNPDGSQAEKSGNGLRIFARWLWDQGQVQGDPFSIWTPGGTEIARVHSGGDVVTVTMGQASFDSFWIPVAGARRQVVDETMLISKVELRYCAVTLGNPHCVVLRPKASAEDAKLLGPLIETDARFPNRTNVQFLEILDRKNLRIEIWERGAGYTLASGSSSCAAAAAAFRLELCDSRVQVHNPGGILEVEISPDYHLTLTGPVNRVAEGVFFYS